MNTNGNAEPHVLRCLDESLLRTSAHKIGLLQRLEAEVVQEEIVFRSDHGIESCGVRANKCNHVGG